MSEACQNDLLGLDDVLAVKMPALLPSEEEAKKERMMATLEKLGRGVRMKGERKVPSPEHLHE